MAWGEAFQRLPTLKHPRRGTCEALWSLVHLSPMQQLRPVFWCILLYDLNSAVFTLLLNQNHSCGLSLSQSPNMQILVLLGQWRLSVWMKIALDYVMLPEPLVENGGIWNNDLADNWQITRSMGQSCALCCLVDAWYNGHDRKVKLRLEASFELSSRTGDGPTPSRQNAGNVNISTDPNCRFMSILLFWCSQGYKAFGWLSRASLMYLFA